VIKKSALCYKLLVASIPSPIRKNLIIITRKANRYDLSDYNTFQRDNVID
jgi:hypothetical protein